MGIRLYVLFCFAIASLQPVCADTAQRLVPLAQLHPTQVAVGMRAVEAKRAEIMEKADSPKRLEKYLAKRPIPVIIGPGRTYYLIDHHHLGLALLRANVSAAYVTVVADLSDLKPDDFWKKLDTDGNLHPFDESGRRIAPTDLPANLLALKNDVYRDLAGSVRAAGGYAKSAAPFSEFSWADFYRSRVPAALINADYQAALSKALILARSHEASQLPGFRR